MTTIMTKAATFASPRSRLYPPNLDHALGYYLFQKDAATSAVNRVPGGAQGGAFEGSNLSFGSDYVEFTGTDTGFNSGLVRGAAAHTMLLMCTRPTLVGGATSGLFAGFHDAESGVQRSIGYQGGTNNNFLWGGGVIGTQAYSQGAAAYAMLFFTSDGTAGTYGRVSAGGLVSGTYTRASDSGTFPFRVGRGRTSSGTGSNAHTMRVHSAALFDSALDATALAAQYLCFSTWANDVGLALA